MTRQFLKRLRTIHYNLLLWESFWKSFLNLLHNLEFCKQQILRHVFYLFVYIDLL